MHEVSLGSKAGKPPMDEEDFPAMKKVGDELPCFDDGRPVRRSWWCIREATGGDGRVCDLGWTRLGAVQWQDWFRRSSRTISGHHSQHCCQVQAHLWRSRRRPGTTQSGTSYTPSLAAATAPLAKEEGTPSKRRKEERKEFDKLDEVTEWSKEMDLRQDADKNSAEATAAMAKYNVIAARQVEQGHALPLVSRQRWTPLRSCAKRGTSWMFAGRF